MLSVVSCSALLVWHAETVILDDVAARFNKVFKYVEHSHRGPADCRSDRGLVLLSQNLTLNLKYLFIWSCVIFLILLRITFIWECYDLD